jgi:hypothetical protein
MDQQISLAKPWYRQPEPWLLMAGPFLVVLAGSFSAYLAVTRPDALVVGDYYRQGKAINVDLRRDQVAASLGLAMQLQYDPSAGRLHGLLTSAKHRDSEAVQLRLMHSTLADKDITLTVMPDTDGRFSADLPMLEMARWQVQAESGGWRLAGTWSWPQQKQIDLAADAPPVD